MKGLFIKDLRLLKGQKQFFMAVLVMMVIFMTAYSNFSFVISYFTIMVGILTLSTISYDEYENGLGYLFTLPVSRKEYVIEKYLFSIATTIPVLALVSVMAYIVSGIRHIEFSAEEWLASVCASFLIVTLMLGLLIPIQLKVGVDKSRAAMMMVFGGGFIVVYIGIKVCEIFEIDWRAGIDRLQLLDPAVVLAALAVICGIFMVVSCLVSLQFVKKREF